MLARHWATTCKEPSARAYKPGTTIRPNACRVYILNQEIYRNVMFRVVECLESLPPAKSKFGYKPRLHAVATMRSKALTFCRVHGIAVLYECAGNPRPPGQSV